MRRLLTVAFSFVLLVLPMPAQALESATPTWVTRGWAGYLVRAGDRSFDRATAAWTQPHVVCNRPGSSAAFWIGLGGARADSKALEQIGTSADCSERAVVSHSAWYQLFPAPPVELPLRIRPGDRLTAEVTVSAGIVGLSLRNDSSGTSFSTEVWMRAPEADSAEWIVEAPSACFARCAPLPLADFGKTTFTSATTSVPPHVGAIGDSAWSPLRLELVPRRGKREAVPTRLSGDGSSFTVTRLHQ